MDLFCDSLIILCPINYKITMVGESVYAKQALCHEAGEMVFWDFKSGLVVEEIDRLAIDGGWW